MHDVANHLIYQESSVVVRKLASVNNLLGVNVIMGAFCKLYLMNIDPSGLAKNGYVELD